MMQFTEQIQIAFAEVTRSGTLPGVADLPERLRDFETDGCELDRLWAELLQHYQGGPRQAWAAVLLEAMRPDLAAAVAAVPAFPPVITREDFAQQLMANVLVAALDRPGNRARWTPNRLISRASQKTQKWLAREIRGFAKRAGYVDGKATAKASLGLLGLLVELEMSSNPSVGMVVLYRQEVLGDSLAEIAAECGLSENALRLRRRRAVERIRQELAAA